MWPGHLWRAEVGQLCLHRCLTLTSFELLYFCIYVIALYWWALALESSVYSWDACWLRWHCQVAKPATSREVSYSRCGESLQSSAFHFRACCVALVSLFKQLCNKTCTRAENACFFYDLFLFFYFICPSASLYAQKQGRFRIYIHLLLSRLAAAGGGIWTEYVHVCNHWPTVYVHCPEIVRAFVSETIWQSALWPEKFLARLWWKTFQKNRSVYLAVSVTLRASRFDQVQHSSSFLLNVFLRQCGGAHFVAYHVPPTF